MISATITFEILIDIEGLRQHVLSFLDIKALHRLLTVKSTLQKLANDELEKRIVYVTEDDVKKGKHTDKLRKLLQEIEPGQTIKLSGGKYLLGDETIAGHAEETITYEDATAVTGYMHDCDWNEWREGYGPLILDTPGIKILGPSDGNYYDDEVERIRQPPVTIAELCFNATRGWSSESNAIRISATGIVVMNVQIKSSFEAIHVIGEQNYESKRSLKHINDVMLKKCTIQGAVVVGNKASCSLKDCIVYNKLPFGTSGIKLNGSGKRTLTRTQLHDCGLSNNPSQFPLLVSSTSRDIDIGDENDELFLTGKKRHSLTLLQIYLEPYGGIIPADDKFIDDRKEEENGFEIHSYQYLES